MPPVPTEMFMDALLRVVKANADYIPPYGTGGSLYVRPLLIGSGAQIGVAPADTYTFVMLVTPAGAYYKGGLKPVRAVILDDYDRAAPQGMGDVKVAGNYAASLFAHETASTPAGPSSSTSTRSRTPTSRSSPRPTSSASRRTAPT